MQIGVFTNTQFISHRVFHWALEITNHQQIFIIKGSPKMRNRKVCVPLTPYTHCLQLENVCCRWLVDLGKTYNVFHIALKAKIKLSGSTCSPDLSYQKKFWSVIGFSRKEFHGRTIGQALPAFWSEQIPGVTVNKMRATGAIELVAKYY